MHGLCVNQPQDTKVLINFFYNKHLYDLLVLFMQIRRETLRDPVCTTLLSFWLCGKRTFSLGVLDGHTRRTTLESDDRFFFLPHRFFMLKAVARSCEEHIFCFTHAPMDCSQKVWHWLQILVNFAEHYQNAIFLVVVDVFSKRPKIFKVNSTKTNAAIHIFIWSKTIQPVVYQIIKKPCTMVSWEHFEIWTHSKTAPLKSSICKILRK